jgi:hypothetical protein
MATTKKEKMKQGILTEIDWAYIGACLANEDDDNQIKFFKAMVKEMQSWGTAYQVELQLAGVNKKLTKEEREALSMLSYDGED